MATVKVWIRRNSLFLLALAWTMMTALFFWVIFPTRFESNDDTAMAGIAYGYHGRYDSHLVYVNIVVGYLLKISMLVCPAIPWYTVFQAVLLLLSVFTIYYLFNKRFGPLRAVIPGMLFAIYFGYEFLAKIQFSKTAGICVIAGFLLLFAALEQEKSWTRYLLAGGLILAGSLYRFSVFEMLLIPMFGAGCLLLWQKVRGSGWKKSLRLCIPVVLILCSCFGFQIFNNWAYQSSQVWSDYLEYNGLRANLLDYGFPDYEENQSLYESLGISKNDYEMYRNWEFADPECFTVEVMRQLVEAKEERSVDPKQFIQEVVPGLTQYLYVAPLAIAGVLSLLAVKRSRKLLSLYELLAFAAVQIYLYWKGRYLVNRIDASLFLAVYLILCLYCWRKEFLPGRRAAAGALAGTLLCVSIPAFSVELQSGYRAREIERETGIYTLLESDADTLYCAASGGFPSTQYSVWEADALGCRKNSTPLGGWKTQSPVMLYIWDQYDIANPFRDIIDRADVRFICGDGVERSLTHIREHYAPTAMACCVRIVEDTYQIYRVVTMPPQIETEQAADGTERLRYEVSVTENDGTAQISGFLYGLGINSFAADIYVGIKDMGGEETLYYTTQFESGISDDLEAGAYGAFSCEVPWTGQEQQIILYLETADGLYAVNAGTA